MPTGKAGRKWSLTTADQVSGSEGLWVDVRAYPSGTGPATFYIGPTVNGYDIFLYLVAEWVLLFSVHSIAH